MSRPLPQTSHVHKRLRWAPRLIAAHVATPPDAMPAAAAPRNPEWAEPVDASVNLFKVTELFYRSARLHEKDLPLLKSLGIATVVSLRSFHSDRRMLSQSGMRAVRVGINTWQINDRNMAAALRAIRDAEKDGPVLLHCMHGADRTGLVAAMYRIAFQGWDKLQALAELTEGGYGYHTLWKNIPSYLQAVDIEAMRHAVATRPRHP
jgi:protein tyrosine/serine phosphatase